MRIKQRKINIPLGLCAGALLAVSPVYAEFTPGKLYTDSGVVITPTVTVGLLNNSNIYHTPSNEKSSAVFTVSPELLAELEDGHNVYSFSALIDSGFYQHDSTDNYVNSRFGLGAHQEFGVAHRLDLTLDADWLSEARGTGLSEGTADTFNDIVKYNQQTFMARYEYGAMSSKARIAPFVGFYNKDYTSFEAVSQYRNHDKLTYGITGYYNTQANVIVLAELKQDDYNYNIARTPESSLDSRSQYALLGMEWKLSSMTSGHVKIGHQNKKFDSALREDFSGLNWEAGLTWMPRSYSTFRFTTSRAARDVLVEGDYINDTRYEAHWQHNWRPQITSHVTVGYANQDYHGVYRKDKVKSARLAVDYTINRFGVLSAFVEMRDKSSTRHNLEFDNTVVGLTFTFALQERQ